MLREKALVLAMAVNGKSPGAMAVKVKSKGDQDPHCSVQDPIAMNPGDI